MVQLNNLRTLLFCAGMTAGSLAGTPGFANHSGDSAFLYWDSATIQRTYKLIDSLYLTGEYSEVIDLTFQLFKHYRNKGNRAEEARCYNILGDVFRAIGDFPGSVEYLNKSLILSAGQEASLLRATTYNFLAATYFEYKIPGHLDSAARFARQSLRLSERLSSDRLEFLNLNILGAIEQSEGNYNGSIQTLSRSLEIARRSYPADVPLVLLNLSGNYDRIGKRATAISLVRQAFELAKSNNIPVYRRIAGFALSEYYVGDGNFREANQFMMDVLRTTDQFIRERRDGWRQSTRVHMENLRQQQEMEILKLTEQKSRENLMESYIWLLFLVILVIGLVFFTVQFARQKRRLQQSNKELARINSWLNKFISIIAHDLKNPFNTILGYTDLLSNEFDNLSPQDRRRALENSHKSAVSAFVLLEQLLDWGRLQSGTISVAPTAIPVADMMEEVNSLVQTSAFLKHQKIGFLIPEGMRIWADRDMMLMVFRNLLSNAIKFTPENGAIEVSASVKDTQTEILVRDTGVGIPAGDLPGLFKLNGLSKRTGTRGERGTGIGLLLCREYLEKNQGTISAVSEVGKGTTFRIVLPGRKPNQR